LGDPATKSFSSAQFIMANPCEANVARLGADGDGVVEATNGAVMVAGALPGERVRLDAEGGIEILLPRSSEWRAPLCRHFGTCGGCAAQHMSARLYANWKRGIVIDAFRHRDLSPEVAPLVTVAPGSRRRAVLTCRRGKNHPIVGYHQRRSHALIDIEECPVLAPEIVSALPGLRALAGLLLERSGELRAIIVLTQAGLDVSLEGNRRLDAALRAEIARVATSNHFCRLSFGGEPVIELARPKLTFAGVAAVPPPGTFLQAEASAEATMTSLVVAAVAKAKRVIDLFAGIGTITFALARSARVLAVDADTVALSALAAAARYAPGLKPIEIKARNLLREPLSAKELDGVDAVVFDPPRAGARAQCEQLARSKVETVVPVSCNPATLARDVRTLVDGGYRLETITPIDQFVFSSHVEVVGVLRR
jgi:23S rRNA (uracil1939-C5)-methyltransferase